MRCAKSECRNNDRRYAQTCRRRLGIMTAVGVRRGKAALSSGCKAHPATAPAGSNRSSHGGDEMAEAFGWLRGLFVVRSVAPRLTRSVMRFDSVS